ncbi:hypothetical protein H310_01575, partial [Aphanomyces invadans]
MGLNLLRKKLLAEVQVPINVNTEHLEEIFGKFGGVAEVTLEKDSSLSKGTAYIRFHKRDDAENAQLHMHEGQIDVVGRRLLDEAHHHSAGAAVLLGVAEALLFADEAGPRHLDMAVPVGFVEVLYVDHRRSIRVIGAHAPAPFRRAAVLVRAPVRPLAVGAAAALHADVGRVRAAQVVAAVAALDAAAVEAQSERALL